MKPRPTIILILALLAAGCGTTGPGTAPVVSKDPVVNAQKTTELAVTTFDFLFHVERDNREWVVTHAPTLHKAVDYLRAHAQDWLNEARRLTKAYQASSTPENLYSLNAAVLTLAQAIGDAKSYATQIQAQKGP